MNAIVHAMLPPSFGDEPSAGADSFSYTGDKVSLRLERPRPVFARDDGDGDEDENDDDSNVPEFDFFD